MRYLSEYRNATAVQQLARAIEQLVTRPWVLMEVCGGQTHAIVKYGLDTLLPNTVELIHGPGCPVCVTPVEIIDKAIAIAKTPATILCTFGDMLRVPGSFGSLMQARSEGGNVHIVYSPLDALEVALKHPEQEVVSLAVGFETTAPAHAMLVYQARQQEIENFSILLSHFLVPPAMQAILRDSDNRVQGFLAAGHVCTVMGYEQYLPIAEEFHVPIVVTGFEPVDILQGVYMCLLQLEQGRSEVENQYLRVVKKVGNSTARDLIAQVFAPTDSAWRGVGEIAASGLMLRPAYQRYAAQQRFGEVEKTSEKKGECIDGDILRGLKKPAECANFGTACTPDHPLGAPMVSSEGACAAYYRYRQ